VKKLQKSILFQCVIDCALASANTSPSSFRQLLSDRGLWKERQIRLAPGGARWEESVMEFIKKNPWVVIVSLLVILVAIGIATS
jgi:uncharacterized membrane protein YdfJ with MMPL/SSD domain